MEQQVWKDIPGYEGHYEISLSGIVRSKDRFVTVNREGKTVKRFLKGSEMGISLDGMGYKRVMLSLNKSFKYKKIHRLIMETFKPNPDPKIFTDINHIDCDIFNNGIENLEWCTRSHNLLHARANNLYQEQYKNKRARILLHTETGIYYTIRDAAYLLGKDFYDMANMIRYKSTLLKHKFLLT